MLQQLLATWRRWREKNRAYAIDRALDKADRAKRGNDHPDIGPMPPAGP